VIWVTCKKSSTIAQVKLLKAKKGYGDNDDDDVDDDDDDDVDDVLQ
jgi:hypothetical protein